jgi:hypothetical protein
MALALALALPLAAASDIVCALGSGTSAYNAYQDQTPTRDALELATRMNRALAPYCLPRCPELALFRNNTTPNLMLVVNSDGQAKIVYAPQFFTKVDETSGDGAIVGLLGHVYGHALDETTPVNWINRGWPPEVRADVWAGCALGKANLSARSLGEALAALAQYPSPAHPGWSQRLPGLRLGYTHCGGEGATFDRGASSRPK